MKSPILTTRFPPPKTVLIPLFAAAVTFGLLGMNLAPAHALSLYSINQTQSGLVGSDPLNAQLSQAQLASSSFWTLWRRRSGPRRSLRLQRGLRRPTLRSAGDDRCTICRILRPSHRQRDARPRGDERPLADGPERLSQRRPLRPDRRHERGLHSLRGDNVERGHLLGRRPDTGQPHHGVPVRTLVS